jgi:CRP-like cAMP-binding protein
VLSSTAPASPSVISLSSIQLEISALIALQFLKVISATLVLNLAYAVLVSSTMTRRILWLRGALVVAGVMFVVYGIMTDNWTMVFWNSVTSVLHSWQAVRYVQSRRQLTLSDADEHVRQTYFADVDPFDFHSLWTMGETREYNEVPLTGEGEEQTKLMLVLDGQALVDMGGKQVGLLHRGDLIGEMSFVSGSTATATVFASGVVLVREWDHDRLHTLDHLNPSAAAALRKRIQENLAEKLLKRSE